MKFKVGDKVVKANGNEWWNGDEYKTITKCLKRCGVSCYELNNNSECWLDNEIELYKESKIEFTFEELLKMKDDDTYINTSVHENVKTVRVTKEGMVRITYANKYNDGLIISHKSTFKVKEEKETVKICRVRHQHNGKIYDFIAKDKSEYYEGNFVICDTRYGKSYGKCVDWYFDELTKSEIKEYRECWRA